MWKCVPCPSKEEKPELPCPMSHSTLPSHLGWGGLYTHGSCRESASQSPGHHLFSLQAKKWQVGTNSFQPSPCPLLWNKLPEECSAFPACVSLIPGTDTISQPTDILFTLVYRELLFMVLSCVSAAKQRLQMAVPPLTYFQGGKSGEKLFLAIVSVPSSEVHRSPAPLW